MKPLSESKKAYNNFLLYTAISVILTVLSIFSYLYFRDHKLVNQQELDRARTTFNNIILSRKWNTEYGGVFVEKKDEIKSNKYLKNPEIYTTDGKTYTKKNPAIMTKEISKLAEKEEFYSFHITSLDPINPANIPDKFERAALELFEEDKSIKEKFLKTTDKKGNSFYRYIAPLITEKNCLQCHKHQGYEEGDIRGGISVSFEITQIEAIYKENMIWLTISLFLTVITLLLLIFAFASKLLNKLKTYEKELLNSEQKNAIHAMSVTANHEINQPLTVLSGYLEIIKMTGTENFTNKQIKALNNMRVSIVEIAQILQKYKNADKIALAEYVKGISMVKFAESKIDE